MKNVMKKNDGFSLVELIVVIVIMLVLAAVMVPNVMKWIGKASEASTKNDAASLLSQVQADVAEYAAEKYQGIATPSVSIDTVKLNNVTATKTEASAYTAYTAAGSGKAALFVVDNKYAVTKFCYQDGAHFITWTSDGGWSKVGPTE